MNTWVYPITQDNLLICLKLKTLGFKAMNAKRAEKINIGDKILFYVSRVTENNFHLDGRVHKFSSIVECCGNVSTATDNICKALNVEIKAKMPIDIVNNKSCSIAHLIDDLSFIKNKRNWGSSFMGGIRQIPNKDFELIKSKLA